MIVITDSFTDQDLIKNSTNKGISFMNNKINQITSEASFILQETITGIMTQIKAREPIFNSKGKFQITSIAEIYNRADELLQIGEYTSAMAIFDGLLEKLSYGIDYYKVKEYKAIALFFKDFFSSAFEFNKELERQFQDVIRDYNKKSHFELLIEADLRIITYYSYFPPLNTMLQVIDKLYQKMKEGTLSIR